MYIYFEVLTRMSTELWFSGRRSEVDMLPNTLVSINIRYDCHLLVVFWKKYAFNLAVIG
jgi:hypothetical protein